MATIDVSQRACRRNVVRAKPVWGLLAPVAFGVSHTTGAQEGATASSGHPAVGVWVEGRAVSAFAYNVFHADGTFAYYTSWLGSVGGNDPKLASLGFGVWQPIDERTFEISFQSAWIDAGVTSLDTTKKRLIVNEAGTRISEPYKTKLVSAMGNVTESDSGHMSADRTQLEPFDEPEVPVATPESQ